MSIKNCLCRGDTYNVIDICGTATIPMTFLGVGQVSEEVKCGYVNNARTLTSEKFLVFKRYGPNSYAKVSMVPDLDKEKLVIINLRVEQYFSEPDWHGKSYISTKFIEYE